MRKYHTKHPLTGMDPEKILECIEAILELVNRPAAFCKGVTARDGSLKPCDPNAVRAESWCLYGAILVVTKGDWELAQKMVTCLTREIGKRGYLSLAVYNDNESYWNVRSMLADLRNVCLFAMTPAR